MIRMMIVFFFFFFSRILIIFYGPREKVASGVPPRTLQPAYDKCYPRVVQSGKVQSCVKIICELLAI